MLVIRLQRTGRAGHAQFRVVVQDARRTPTSGKIVALVGTFNPHSKAVNLNKERVEFYLGHGAQPSPRVVRLLKAEKIKLPKWVEALAKAEGKTKNPDKRRSTRPEQPAEPSEPATEAEAGEAPETANSEPAETTEETPAEAAETNAETTEDSSEADDPAEPSADK